MNSPFLKFEKIYKNLKICFSKIIDFQSNPRENIWLWKRDSGGVLERIGEDFGSPEFPKTDNYVHLKQNNKITNVKHNNIRPYTKQKNVRPNVKQISP